jgi:hypothetical protein
MNKLFGVCSNSMQNIHYILASRYGRKHVVILSNSIQQRAQPRYKKHLRQAKLYLAGSVADMLANVQELNKHKEPILIFDNIIALQNYNCVLLDAQSNGILNTFKHQLINYPILFNAVEAKNRQRHQIQRKPLDLLPQIIKDNTVLGFMDKFNSMLYAITIAQNRTMIRNIMVRYVFGKLSVVDFEQQLIKHQVKLTAKSKPLLAAVIEYMQSAKGKILQQALQQAQIMENLAAQKNVTKRRNIKYKELSEQYGVDSFELRNLILLYRAL